MGNLQDGREPPHGRPIVLYDGECPFCMRQVDRLRRWTGDAVAFEAYQTAGTRFPSIPREAFARSVQLVGTDGSVSSGAEAVFRAMAVNPRMRAWLWCYLHAPGFAAVSEWGYRVVARRRETLARWLP